MGYVKVPFLMTRFVGQRISYFFPDTWAANETGETTQTDGIANSTVQKLKALASQY
jgi:hypothetical protein